MAITIESEPLDPHFTKNVIAYRVISDASPDEIRARIFYENVGTTPTIFITEQKGIPDENGEVVFYLEDLFEVDVLNYERPVMGSIFFVANKVSKHYRVLFYEYNSDDLILHDEAYHEGSSAADITIDALDNAKDYIIITDKENANGILQLKLGGTTQNATKLYELGDEIWYELTPTADHDTIVLDPGIKATLYEGTKPSQTASSIHPVIIAGGNFELAGNQYIQTFEGSNIQDYEGQPLQFS